jgi:hypothetical protein
VQAYIAAMPGWNATSGAASTRSSCASSPACARRFSASGARCARRDRLDVSKMLRAFHVGKARTSHDGPQSWMRRSLMAAAQLSWPACHLTKASASAVMYRSSSRPAYVLQISVSPNSINNQYRSGDLRPVEQVPTSGCELVAAPAPRRFGFRLNDAEPFQLLEAL